MKMEERIEPPIETVAEREIQTDLGTEEMTEEEEMEEMVEMEEEMERGMEGETEVEMEEEEIVEMIRHVTDVGLDRRKVVTMATTTETTVTILVPCRIAEAVEEGEAVIIGEEEMTVSWVAVLLLFHLSLRTATSCPLDAALGFLLIITNSGTSKLREKECCSNKTREWI